MQSKYIRTIGIVLAVILSMAAIFYIGGLVNQFNLNYQKWLAEGGITGKVVYIFSSISKIDLAMATMILAISPAVSGGPMAQRGG